VAPFREPRRVVGDNVGDGRNEVDAVIVGVDVNERVRKVGVA